MQIHTPLEGLMKIVADKCAKAGFQHKVNTLPIVILQKLN